MNADVTKHSLREENEPALGRENHSERLQLKIRPQTQRLLLQQPNVPAINETTCDRTKCFICGKIPYFNGKVMIETFICDGARGGDTAVQQLMNNQQEPQREPQLDEKAILNMNLMELVFFDCAPRIVLDRHPKVDQAVASRMSSVAGKQVLQINRELACAGLSLQNRYPYSNMGTNSSIGSSSQLATSQQQSSRRAAQDALVATAAVGGSSLRCRETETLCKSLRTLNDSMVSTTSLTRSRIVVPFLKNEIVTGNWLGSGGFSCVFEVTSFEPQEELAVNPVQQAARSFLSEHAQRQCDISVVKQRKQKSSSRRMEFAQATEARYAIKHLRYGLADIMERSKFEEAAVDLVREGCVLANLDHPNIIRIHGWSYHGAETYRTGYYTDFFLIVDKMTQTLESRIWSWRQSYRKYKSRVTLPWIRNKFICKIQRLWIERIKAALGVGRALTYMHKHGLMHRDIKTSNVGFDVRGDIKIFDFGLSQLLPRDKDSDGELDPASKTLYHLPRAGTKYYMAPEVQSKGPYNVSADVYSYGVLLWEILTLSQVEDAVKEIQPNKEDLGHGERWLPLCPCWPQEIGLLVKDCLCSNPHHRPTMEYVVTVLAKHLTQQQGRPHVDQCYSEKTVSNLMVSEDEVEDCNDAVARRRSTFRLDLSGIDLTEFDDTCTTSFRSNSSA